MSVCECLCGVGVGFTVSVWGFQGFGLVMFGAPGTALPGTALPGTAQNFALFFPSPAATFVLFFHSMGVFSLNFGVFEAPGPSNVHVWALGLSCETPAAPPDRAAGARTRQPENSKRAHLSAPALQTPPKFHEKTPREGKKERIFRRDREKKSAKFRAPTLRTPTLRGPTLLHPPTTTQHTHPPKKKQNN